MTTKNCIKCRELKPLSEFSNSKSRKDGLHNICKPCANDYSLTYRKTKNGISTSIYADQKKSSKQRNHPMPSYTNLVLRSWLLAQKKFHVLFDLWVESGYKKMQKPSCDRLDDYKPYTLGNIQVITWQENLDKAGSDIRNGVNNKNSKSVVQTDINGNFIKEYYSAAQASRDTGVPQGNISFCCKGKCKMAGRFKWGYTKNLTGER